MNIRSEKSAAATSHGKVGRVRHRRILAVSAGAAVIVAALLGVSPAVAADAGGASGSGTTVTVNGHQFGPEDGVTVTNESFELDPDSMGTVGEHWGTELAPGKLQPLTTWGASYATSTEYIQYFYEGVAKAAGNVYSSQRIIQVCIQYTRSGVGVADRRCSNAIDSGNSWSAGAEVQSFATDSLDPNAPHTIFNIQTTRINPSIY